MNCHCYLTKGHTSVLHTIQNNSYILDYFLFFFLFLITILMNEQIKQLKIQIHKKKFDSIPYRLLFLGNVSDTDNGTLNNLIATNNELGRRGVTTKACSKLP